LGQTENTYARQNLNIAFGNKKNDFSYSFSGLISRAQRSNLIYTDAYGSSYSMVGNSDINAWNANLGLHYKNLSFRFIQDNLYTTQRDQFEPILSKAYRQDFKTSLIELKYDKQVTKKLSILAKVNYKYGIPWFTPTQYDSIDESYLYQIKTERYRGNIAILWDVHRAISITAGIEAYHDKATKSGDQFFTKDSTQIVNYLNYAPYIQTLLKTRFANITMGARYDVNSAFGSAFNPRLGITKKIAFLNLKLLYASSYRAPSIENIQTSIGATILPEHSQTFEFEAGYQMSKNTFLSVNIFNITTLNSIYYLVYNDPNSGKDMQGYSNNKELFGSRGLEAEYKYKSAIGSLTASYAYYTSLDKQLDDQNAVPFDKRSNLGVANHKFSLVGTYTINQYFFATTSFYVLGKRYGCTTEDSLENGTITAFNPQVQMNVYFGCKELIKGFTFGFGIRNVTNQRIIYIQPYNSFHAPLPGMGREFNFKIVYTFKK
jgi:outer membrane receptor protein involved in Fe transport